MHAARDHGSRASGDAVGHEHGFGGGGRSVIHRGIRHFHAGEFADHRLEFKDRLQCSLCDLWLVRRVRGEELAARNQAVDHHRAVVVVGAGAKKTGVAERVLRGALAEIVENFRLGHLARNVEVALNFRVGRDRREQVVDGADTNFAQHLVAVTG